MDESGSDGLRDRYYLLTLVIHDQTDDIAQGIALYERSLAEKRMQKGRPPSQRAAFERQAGAMVS